MLATKKLTTVDLRYLWTYVRTGKWDYGLGETSPKFDETKKPLLEKLAPFFEAKLPDEDSDYLRRGAILFTKPWTSLEEQAVVIVIDKIGPKTMNADLDAVLFPKGELTRRIDVASSNWNVTGTHILWPKKVGFMRAIEPK